ncbi:MAG: hypothetical protein WAX14_13510 [Rhodococcus sp. (in: high G+C Gram-positive bacteria)]|uniref:hypothetical protein n=1 Tax=Rhodococcus sp. TaxID=1831 RepID=UPI003BB80719
MLHDVVASVSEVRDIDADRNDRTIWRFRVRHALAPDPDRAILPYHGVRTCADVHDPDFFRELEIKHCG